MRAAPAPVDPTAELLERLAVAEGVDAACSLVLGRVAADAGIGRAVLVAWSDDAVAAVGLGYPDEEVAAFGRALQADAPDSLAPLHLARPARLVGDHAAFGPFAGAQVVPFAAPVAGLSGAVLLDPDTPEEVVERVSGLAHRAAPGLGRCWQLERAESRLQGASRQLDLLRGIVDALPDPVLLTSPDNAIVMSNRRAERLFAFSDADSEGRRRAIQINTLLFSSLLTRSVPGREAEAGGRELNLVDPGDGSDLVFEVLSDPLAAGVAPEGAVLSILRDITDPKRAVAELEDQVRRSRVAEHQAWQSERLARELRNLNARLEDRVRGVSEELEERNRRLEWQSSELERAYRLKSEFLASMSHELRTPINVILGYTSLVRERIYGDLTRQQEEALSKIYNTSQHLLELINDILDLSRIEAGKMPLHLECVAVAEIVAELSSTVEPMVAKKRLSFEAHVQDRLPTLETDRAKLRQILLNLISNAIKFTHRGTITLTAEASSRPGHVCLVVADTGIGMRPEHLDVIFEDFRQVDQSRTREYGGTGLGLSITKKLLTLLGGVISVESRVGEGSRFCIELPVRTEPASIEDQVRRAVVDADRAVMKS